MNKIGPKKKRDVFLYKAVVCKKVKKPIGLDKKGDWNELTFFFALNENVHDFSAHWRLKMRKTRIQK